MKNRILILLGILVLFLTSAHAEQWKLHPTYADYLQRIIDTPKYTYLLSGNQPYVAWAADYSMRTNSLFRYDKAEKEVEWLNIQNLLSAPVIVTAEYNFEKSYLMVCYDNGDIDLIYDNGNVVNVPGLKVADSSYSKKINSVTFTPGGNEAYVATSFGYITVNVDKGEVGTSRILDDELTAAVAFDDKIYFGTSSGLYRMEPRGEAEKVPDVGAVTKLYVLGKRLYINSGTGWDGRLLFIDAGDPAGEAINLASTYIMGVEPTKDGILVSGYGDMWSCDREGRVSHYSKPGDARGKLTSGCDGRKFWVNLGLEGLRQIEGEPESASWNVTAETILPNAANCFKSTAMAYSDTYGMLVRNHGYDYNFNSIATFPPDYISGLKGSYWTPYSIASKAADKMEVLNVYNPSGLAIDPMEKDVVYCGSVLNGILRLNLADPSRSMRFGLVTDPASGNREYVGIATPPSNPDIKTYVPFGAPSFDQAGYMWITYFNIDAGAQEIWYWSPEDRKATTSDDTYKPMKKWVVPGLSGSNASCLLPLSSTSNRNIIVVTVFDNHVMKVIDHKGTFDNQKDDKVYTFTKNIYDQDGTKFECKEYRTFYEDSSTGNVWVGTDAGVFYFNPSSINEAGDTRVNRVKVPRNDGTSFADYLLDGACINMITSDGQGRKWFATNGGGLTCTTPNGSQVLKTYTAENSYLPSNQVYGICYNPSSNSMMISTDAGLAELFLSEASVEGGGEERAVAYPNPVRPDYFGYVNIEGLEDGALVKITDSAGNLVKELGFADGGTIRWDVTNLNNKRVRSGVYYVLASGGPESSGFSAATKILVVN
ncbi:MAG: T9SS type A sorting domain-containing protein [Muribaculaceae bacterium]|nr:T9SS type A sorting domain-containing protein [Muribaculaceae bacterium]